LSTEPRPIKVVNTAPSKNIRVDEIVINTAQTSKVTAVIAVMSIYCKKRCNLKSADYGDKKRSRQKAESVNFPEENSRGLRNLSLKTRKGQLPKKLGLNRRN
jgi:hypothetical protein